MKNSSLHSPTQSSPIRALATSVLALALAFALTAAPRTSQAHAATTPNVTRIHVLSFSYTDAIVLESNGHFGIVDSGEDDDYPDGSDPRYPLREGVTVGNGVEKTVIAYLKSLGVTKDNLEFYIGTHPHSDHIGSADEIIRTFTPDRVYLSEYQDSFISDKTRLWDNQYVYDHAVAAALETGAVLIQNLNPSAPIAPAAAASEELLDELEPAGDAPEAELLNANEVAERFGVDPTDPASPFNPESLPDAGVAATLSSNPNTVSEHTPNPATTGNPRFSLGDMTIEIVNYSDDYKFHPVPDANYFSWGVKVTANGSTAFLAGDINNYEGDEDKLAGVLGRVDLLKMGHHGFSGSNTPAYLASISPEFALQTGYPDILPADVASAIDRLGIRHFTAPEAASGGFEAMVATFARNGIDLNVMDENTVFRTYASSPHVVAYREGLKEKRHGWSKVGPTWYWFDNNAAATENAWIKTGGKWYWLTETGAMATGWIQMADGTRYYLDGSGAMLSGGWHKLGGNWYWFAGSGAMQTGWLKTGGMWYWLDPSTGKMATGWVKTPDGTWYYLNGSGAMQTGWLSQGGSWYYLNGSGAMATGWLKTGGTWYWLDPESGRMATGWAKTPDGTWYYLSGSGAMQAAGWLSQGNAWYWLAGSGAMQTGWLKTGGAWYWLDLSSGRMATGWVKTPDGAWYYLSGSGAMETGWISSGGHWYYLNGSGAMQTGWAKVGETWYWLEESGAMATGWLKAPDSTWYYLDGSGAMKTGWQSIGGKRYHLDGSGAMTTGWFKNKGRWYYLDPDSGAMATGTTVIDGVSHTFNTSGACLSR